jgi:2-polyprenyl-6-methoxyphenol hydroxylase-like FAD-dependent oxidoreductase
MAAALGEEVISLLADRSTLAIERRPRTDTVWVFRRGEKWKDTTLKHEARELYLRAFAECLHWHGSSLARHIAVGPSSEWPTPVTRAGESAARFPGNVSRE